MSEMPAPYVQVFALVASALGLCLAYCVFDRLCFSPLARFPGPKLAALAGWYEIWYELVNGPIFSTRMSQLHDRFGETFQPLKYAAIS